MRAKCGIGVWLVASILLAAILGCPTTQTTQLPVSVTAPLKLARG